MDIEITKEQHLEITMIDYIKECMDVYGKGQLKDRRTPAGHDLFEIDKNSPSLDNESSELFYHIVAKLLYVAKGARLDIELTI